MPHPDFPNSVTYNAMENKTSRFRSGNATVVAPSAAELTNAISYANTYAPGTVTLAALLASMGGGATKLISLSITCATGTMSFTQGGTITPLAAGAIITKPFNEGFALDDFSFTVDAASTAHVEARGV